jgi:dTDP-4-amino-4,6-dideoxygalactose transaminase
MIPYYSFGDIPISVKTRWEEAISRVIASNRYIGGEEVTRFEGTFSNYIGSKFGVGVGNGLDALTIGLKALGIGPGDEVAVPSHTFIATWLAVAAVGAKPIGIDSDSRGLMDLNILEKLTKRPKAVVPVHMHGQMVDMIRLMSWARKFKVKVIEDCAQAHGAKMGDKLAGSWGDVGAFSFYPTKNLGAVGDAGMVVTDNEALFDKMKSLGNYGSTKKDKYEYERLGANSRLDPIQAAVLAINLEYLDEWNNKRQEIADIYLQRLHELGVKTLVHSASESIWHHFIVLASNRQSARQKLEQNGIGTEIHYPNTAEDVFTKVAGAVRGDPSQARLIANKTLSIPLTPWMNSDQVGQVLESFTDDSVLLNFLGEM